MNLAQIKQLFPDYTHHEQVDSKQLFICSNYVGTDTANKHNRILVSYRTIVGWYDAVLCTWVLTRAKYSPTTSKQLSQFAYNHNVTWVDTL